MVEILQSRLHMQVTGRVQGVGFRYFVQEKALLLDLKGWVRNRWNGSVEIIAEGEKTDLESLLSAVERGPRARTTSAVKCTWLEHTGEFHNFRIRRTE